MDDQDSACIEESVVKRFLSKSAETVCRDGRSSNYGLAAAGRIARTGFADFDPQRPRFPLKALAFKATGTYQMEGLGSHHP